MKKALSLILVLAMVFMMVPSVAIADSVAPFELVETVGDGTVTLALNTTSDFEMSALDFTINVPEGCSITSVSQGEDYAETGAATPSINGEKVSVLAAQFNSATTVPAGKEFFVIVVDTSNATADDLTFSITITAAADFDDIAHSWQGATVTTADITTPGYTAGVTVTGNTVTVGTSVTVNVGVSHSEDETFNAGEVVLVYNPEYLELDTNSVASWEYKIDNGTLTIEDFGADKNFSTSNYAVAFNTIKVGTATVTLGSAAFVDKEGATTSDLIEATISPASVEITINEVTYNVDLPDDGKIDGNSVATKGQDYTFTVDEPGNYTYDVTVTVGGTEIDTVTGPDENGQYTIPASSVTGNIVITYTREAKTYSVTVNGDDKNLIALPSGVPTYGVDYTFTIPENTLPTTSSEGNTYTVTVTVNGADYNPVVTNLNYTITGTDIVGDIVITIETETTPVTPMPQVTVQIDGSTDVKVNGEASVTVDEGTEVTLTLSAEPGYIYSVVVGSGDPVTFTNNEYKFTANEDVTIFVTKTLDVSKVAITEYVQVDGYVVWLVTFAPSLDGKVPTYGNDVMYWSDSYDAYCYLVITNTLNLDTAKAAIGAVTGSASDKEVNYGMDINGTGMIDAADAQMVWNMYNAMYNDNFTSVTMAKFLAADQNATKTDDTTWKLTVQDAQTIIDAILNGTAS